jgi:hypothetical protein
MAQSLTEISGHQNFTEFLDAYSSALAKNVWLETFPARLAQVIPVRRENFWFLRDAAGNLLPIDPNFTGAWKLFAVSGNRPVNLFAEWNGETLLPLTAWAENQLLRF